MNGPTLDTTIRAAKPHDVAAITVLLAGALDRDPVIEWLLPDAAEWVVVLHRLLAVDVDHAIETGAVDVALNLSAVAVWRRHDPNSGFRRFGQHHLPTFAGSAAPRIAALNSAIDSYRSSAPHHWLSWLAVHPSFRGRGLASELLRRHHQVVDDTGLPVYTVVTTESARDMLREQGYHAALPLNLPSGPKLWPLIRNARPVRPTIAPPHNP
ncbi:GNAT family N-acetyltransferase [Micromonospora sp. NPDC002717]|uniref:GNAT family N-acetyltransferase n=1 Tax=Micromonospora sp. NPDC002717 TaxID=3154424 RepID=UPI00331F9F5B